MDLELASPVPSQADLQVYCDSIKSWTHQTITTRHETPTVDTGQN